VSNAEPSEGRPTADQSWEAAAQAALAVRVEWDIDLEVPREYAGSHGCFSPNVLERSVRLVVHCWLRAMASDAAALRSISAPGVVDAMLHPPEIDGRGRQHVTNARIRRIRITGIDGDENLLRILLYVEVCGRRYASDKDGAVIAGDPSHDVCFTEFWTLDPHGTKERPWRLIDDVCRIWDVWREWEFVARRETPVEFNARCVAEGRRPPAAPGVRRLRVSGIRREGIDRAGEYDEVIVEREDVPLSWQAERILFAADDPELAASLAGCYFTPRYSSIELVELLDGLPSLCGTGPPAEPRAIM
jgi:hypothetical protein